MTASSSAASEQGAHNALCEGSSPSWPTTPFGAIARPDGPSWLERFQAANRLRRDRANLPKPSWLGWVIYHVTLRGMIDSKDRHIFLGPVHEPLGEKVFGLVLIPLCLAAAPFIQATRLVVKAVQKTWSMAGRFWYGEGS